MRRSSPNNLERRTYELPITIGEPPRTTSGTTDSLVAAQACSVAAAIRIAARRAARKKGENNFEGEKELWSEIDREWPRAGARIFAPIGFERTDTRSSPQRVSPASTTRARNPPLFKGIWPCHKRDRIGANSNSSTIYK
ncbi:hypothetical protein AEB_P0158 [Altererythrobacter sp. B11]|nr:hypothetical protein AEB_P0158 [Altererythrobacter sp. B11]